MSDCTKWYPFQGLFPADRSAIWVVHNGVVQPSSYHREVVGDQTRHVLLSPAGRCLSATAWCPMLDPCRPPPPPLDSGDSAVFVCGWVPQRDALTHEERRQALDSWRDLLRQHGLLRTSQPPQEAALLWTLLPSE